SSQLPTRVPVSAIEAYAVPYVLAASRQQRDPARRHPGLHGRWQRIAASAETIQDWLRPPAMRDLRKAPPQPLSGFCYLFFVAPIPVGKRVPRRQWSRVVRYRTRPLLSRRQPDQEERGLASYEWIVRTPADRRLGSAR